MYGFNDHIVYICLHSLTDLLFQTCMDHAFLCCVGVFDLEGHCVKVERVVWHYKCRCGLIRLCHLNLVVTGVCVEEAR